MAYHIYIYIFYTYIVYMRLNTFGHYLVSYGDLIWVPLLTM